MPTLKKRTNISLDAELDEQLEKLALRDEMPKATKAAQLIKLAIELEEDIYLEKAVQKRTTENTKFISHEDAWQ
jgi:predicted DNA-binding protein